MPKAFVPAGACIIADDLTGACDAAAAFARRGAATEVRLRPGLPSAGTEVQALCTASRDIPPEHAARVIEGVLRGLDIDPAAQLFKKIDSVFRGNTFVEIAATVRALPQRLAVIAPAYPALGRRCVDGKLHLRDLTGHRSISLREPMHATGPTPHWLAPELDADLLRGHMHTALSVGAASFFCEAASDQHMQAIVQAARALNRPILWVGSAGLAHALAEELYPDSPLAPTLLHDGILLAFTGSNHPVSSHQLTHLRERHDTHDLPSLAPRRASPSVVLLGVERGRTTDAEILEAIRDVDHESTGCLLMNGGDTALQVCRALDIHAIRIHNEFDPGIPIGTACGGRFEGCTVILKSGGFGDPDLLSRIAQRCTAGREVTT